MGKIFNKIFNVLLILIILALATGLILKALGIINIYKVETGSMEDKIHSGDYVLIHSTDDYSVGDVITYRVDNYFVTHRIIKIEDGKITTKGDANNISDDEVSTDQIEGKVIYNGQLLNFIIDYKFVIAAFVIGLYLLNAYFDDSKKKIEKQ